MAQNSILKKSQKVNLADGHTVTVVKEIGRGGQGVVYKVVDKTKKELALKWYYGDLIKQPKVFYNNLKENTKTGSPSPAFLWPVEITNWYKGTFGYVMPILPNNYRKFSDFLLAKVRFASYSSMVDAALNIVAAFKDLHNKGYNYQDLNDGNFFINPQTGEVLIGDNDNVMGHGQSSGVLGKSRYMAPEVVRRDKTPSKLTDRFSLSIILFMLLVGDHPLEGTRTRTDIFTITQDKKFFGIEPLFIFDEHDSSNRPVKNLHINAIACWPCLPDFIRKAFVESFSQECLLQEKGRLLEQQWIHLLLRLKSSIVRCPECNAEIFLDVKEQAICPDCQSKIQVVGYLEFAKKRSNIEICVPIFEGICLYEYQISVASDDYQTEVATILAKPGKFGLKNNSNFNWTITAPSGKTSIKQKGEVAILGLGFKIDFGNDCIAEVFSTSKF
ncbi:hypothetical protein JZO70_09040 [Enterococcus sp. 669A]|uniref:Protein kinase domain-containing protein n=1 Tax=Candidatus Enterococcus moelleringii TaxID=2815325 RepID=A0ABS3LD58_9ENTE|nr:serine/threonine-protein kinase [Enterococcus sp. 669A]MBO1306304.1 hypothetical protein [Enterococcus sp. 669A]